MGDEDDLEDYFQTDFQLKQKWGYSLKEIDMMTPIEREICISLIKAEIENNKKK